MIAAEASQEQVDFAPRGAARELMTALDRELLLEGPAGSGKTRPILELLHLLATSKPGFRGLICRKVGATLATTCLVTFRRLVLRPQDQVRFFGGSKDRPAAFTYSNGSEIVVGGLDVGADGTQSKILSSEYDAIYFNEAVEGSVEDWETLTTRLRPFVLRHPRLIGDCNPSYGSHWLNLRAQSGTVRRFVSLLEDNPLYFDAVGQITAAGQAYLAGLDALTGARYERLRLGLWTGVENAVYGNFERAIHIRPLPAGLRFRSYFGVDYGRVHKAAVVVVSVDQYGRRWVRAVWGKPDDAHGQVTARQVGLYRQQFGATSGVVDPNQDVLISLLGPGNVSRVKLAEGARQARVDRCHDLFDIYASGRVPSLAQEVYAGPNQVIEHGPFQEEDSPGLILAEGAEGILELAEQIEAYHYVRVQTERTEKLEVALINEDLVAAMEYACAAADAPVPDLTRPLPSLTRMR